MYHVSRKVGWNRRVVWQEQGSSNVHQNRDSTEVQLWALNVNYWTLPNTGQAHHLEHNRRGKTREQKLITLPICRHTQYKICLSTDINAQIHWPEEGGCCRTQQCAECDAAVRRPWPPEPGGTSLKCEEESQFLVRDCEKAATAFPHIPENVTPIKITLLMRT